MAKKASKQTKSKIVSAAWRLFYEQGYDNTTVDEIIAAKGRFGLYGVNIPANGGFVTADVIKKLHDAGLWISIWYVNNPKVAEKFRAAGADAFVTRGANNIRIKNHE